MDVGGVGWGAARCGEPLPWYYSIAGSYMFVAVQDSYIIIKTIIRGIVTK